MTGRLALLAIVAVVAVQAALLGGCGSDAESSGGAASPLRVSAASSLQQAFRAYSDRFDGASVNLAFAGSDDIAAQIKLGVRPDVFAAANTALPDELYAQGLVEQPVVFAGNRLVLAVPAEGAKVGSLADAQLPGVKLAIGSKSVPVGTYTRKVLATLPAGERQAILANVKSEEPDVKGVVGKLTQGAVDAGFVYATDVAAAKGVLEAIELPASLEPSAAYSAAVVKGTGNPVAAKAFIDGLVAGEGRQALAAAGFEPPPK